MYVSKKRFFFVPLVVLLFAGCNSYRKLIGQDTATSTTDNVSAQTGFEAYGAALRKELSLSPGQLSEADIHRVICWVVQQLLQSDATMDAWRAKWYPVIPSTSYFHDFMGPQYTLVNRSGAFCQKSALSSAETLFALGVYSRQIHMTNKTTHIGDHQFFEYWDGAKWHTIDPYFGVYFEKDGEPIRANDLRIMGGQGVNVRPYMVEFDPSRRLAPNTDLDHLAWCWNNESLSDGVNLPAWIKDAWPVWE